MGALRLCKYPVLSLCNPSVYEEGSWQHAWRRHAGNAVALQGVVLVADSRQLTGANALKLAVQECHAWPASTCEAEILFLQSSSFNMFRN